MVFERQAQILNYLYKEHFATIKKLSSIVWSSESSVRRDVKALEQKGFVKQIYGGVVLMEYANSVVPLSLRDCSNSAVKEAIAKKAAEQIYDGAAIFMDGSSTVRRMIKYMCKFKNLKIITNNQKLFSECGMTDASLYCTGGRFLQSGNIFVGASAEDYVRGINADIMFFSSQAISDDGIISDASEEETALRRVMLSRAKTKIFLCDSSKIGQVRAFTLCTRNDIDMIVCEKKLPWENDF